MTVLDSSGSVSTTGSDLDLLTEAPSKAYEVLRVAIDAGGPHARAALIEISGLVGPTDAGAYLSIYYQQRKRFESQKSGLDPDLWQAAVIKNAAHVLNQGDLSDRLDDIEDKTRGAK